MTAVLVALVLIGQAVACLVLCWKPSGPRNRGQALWPVPGFILDAAKKSDATKVPLNFMSDADSTGGNSGSPMVNGRGELVGLNFDRPWENVANDFGYNPTVARNISVDIQFFIWLVRDVQKAENIVHELGLER